MIEALSYGFMKRALLGGGGVILVLSLLSFFVVTRRLAFIGVGISHSAFGGLALGVLLHLDPLRVALPFAVLVGLGIWWVRERGGLREDTAIGIFFSASMALGIVILSLSRTYTGDIFAFLFGDILAITPEDIGLVLLLGTGVLLFLAAGFRGLLYLAFDEELARAYRLPVGFLNYGFVAALAVAIVLSIKLIGVVLVEGVLVIPAAASLQLARTYRAAVGLSLLFGLISLLVGLFAAYFLNLPAGATIVLTASLLFGLALLVGRRRHL